MTLWSLSLIFLSARRVIGSIMVVVLIRVIPFFCLLAGITECRQGLGVSGSRAIRIDAEGQYSFQLDPERSS
jgi:hypothetical protein